jgi:protein SCO1
MFIPIKRHARRRLCGLLAGGLTAFAAVAAPLPAFLPGDSIYQLTVPLTDQQGRAFEWSARRGRPQLVSLFYTSCQFVCPRLIDTLRDIELALPPDARDRYAVLLVTLDPERDSVQALQQVLQQRRLDPGHWTLARAESGATRRLAAVLGIQYRALPNGDFNHATTLILVDEEGRIVARSQRLGLPDPGFLAQITRALRRQP